VSADEVFAIHLLPVTFCDLVYDSQDDRCIIGQNDGEGDMSELIMRPAHNDHRLVEALLATSGGVRQIRPPLSRLVLDAPVALKQPVFVQAAEASGTPVLIDPLTFYLQDDVRSDDSWRRLPFAPSGAVPISDFDSEDFRKHLIRQVVDFELEYGATAVIAPYLLLDDDDRVMSANRRLIRETRDYLEARRLNIPLVVVAAMTAGPRVAGRPLGEVLNVFNQEASSAGAANVALAMSGTGGADDRSDRVHLVLQATNYLASLGASVLAWRQGLLGPSAVAAGATGYECGIGLREQCDLVSLQRTRRPGPSRGGFAPPAGVFIQPFGRSLAKSIASRLLEDQKLRPRLICDNERCCPNGAASMLESPRPHAVQARSQHLAELDRMPSRDWRLNAVARESENGAVLADLATRVLQGGGLNKAINSRALTAVASAADFLREEGGRLAG
jgi:hypothetical protein